jgi:hypothetical protein
MSDINTIYSYFDTYNYTGTISTSSYALPFTPFSFRPRLDLQVDYSSPTLIAVPENTLSRKRIVWDLGDGTITEAVTANHSYTEPGRYRVTCYLYDRSGEGYYDIFTQDVNVYNYIPDAISLSASSTSTLALTAGKYIKPVLVTRSTSWQYYTIPANPVAEADNFFAPPSPVLAPEKPRAYNYNFDITKPISLITFVSGGSAANYFDENLNNTHYGHLYPYSSTFILNEGADGLTEFLEVSSIDISSTPIFIKLSGTSIVRTDESDEDSFFCGTTGSQLLYYKDDLPSNLTNILIGYQGGALKPYSNTSTVGYKVQVAKNRDYDSLSITSNGLDGEGTLPNLFPIDKNKFAGSKIGIVIKVKDSDNFTVKDIPLLQYPSDFIKLALTDGTTQYTADISSDFGSLSSLSSGGFWKGYIIPRISTLTENVYLSAVVNIGGTQVSGISNTFNIYPSGGYYNIAKQGEDVDFESIFKEIAIQPLFLDKTVLFNDFLGSIFGNIDSLQDTIGKVTYEKITNFVDNNAVLDFSNIDQLLAIFASLKFEDLKFSSNNFNVPKELKRLVDLLSINHSRLFGSQNKFKENFKTFGYFNSDLYGKNLGEEVTISYTITAGQDLVAFEKFGGNYTLLNTYLPLSASSISLSANNTYALSSYNSTWGWNLTIPSGPVEVVLPNYYIFYKYKPGIDGTITDSVINFEDGNTTLSFNTSSYNEWSQESGIISNIVSQKLYSKLKLFV